MNASLERLMALVNERVWVAVVRAKDQHGPPVFRSGRLRLLAAPDDVQFAFEAARDRPIAQVVDADGAAIVTFLGRDRLSLANGRVRAEFRSSLRVDVAGRPFPAPEPDAEAATPCFAAVARELAAELEAGFRAALLLRPDPDPDASLRARHGVPPIEAAPLPDGSVRFAVGHAAATLRPGGAGIRLICVGSEIRAGRQVTEIFEPAHGPHYDLGPHDVERLAADIRAFLSNRRDRFISPPDGSRR
jgi:hypothetical protein